MKLSTMVAGAASALTLVACITVNVYFPAPDVRRAAEDIVEETWGADGPSVSSPTTWNFSFGPEAAFAKDADLNVSTAAIRDIKSAMGGRSGQLKPFLAAGNVGIGHDGLLVARDLDGVALKDKALLRRLVDAENADRERLYSEIAKANDFGAERVSDIRKIFAETWIDKAESGWWVEAKPGAWMRK